MKKKYVAMSLLCSTVLMISACGSNVEDTQNSVSANANDSVVMVTAEPTAEPTVEPTVEPSVEVKDETQSTSDSNANSGSYNTSISTEDTTYCEFESIEPTTLFCKADGTMYGNPNMYEGQLITEGGFGVGEELTFNYKTTYNDVEYMVIKNDAGLVLMAPSDCLSATPVEVNTETPAPEQTQASAGNSDSNQQVINDKYEEGSLASTLPDEKVAQAEAVLREQGYSEQEIYEILYYGGDDTKITEEQMNDPEIDRRLRGEYTEEELEALRGLAGRHTH